MRRIACVSVLVLTFGCAATPPGTSDCHSAVDAYWPRSSQQWAHRIVNRESRGNAGAQNRRSSAAGCFQLLKLHAGRFAAVGYSWNDRFNPTANTLAALNLYREQGTRPWR